MEEGLHWKLLQSHHVWQQDIKVSHVRTHQALLSPEPTLSSKSGQKLTQNTLLDLPAKPGPLLRAPVQQHKPLLSSTLMLLQARPSLRTGQAQLTPYTNEPSGIKLIPSSPKHSLSAMPLPSDICKALPEQREVLHILTCEEAAITRSIPWRAAGMSFSGWKNLDVPGHEVPHSPSSSSTDFSCQAGSLWGTLWPQ